MKVIYKGHEITVERDVTMAGYEALFLSIIRLDDGLEGECDTYYGAESVREMIAILKSRVDNELESEDPWGALAHHVNQLRSDICWALQSRPMFIKSLVRKVAKHFNQHIERYTKEEVAKEIGHMIDGGAIVILESTKLRLPQGAE